LTQLLPELDSTLVLAIFLPLGALIAGWTLQMACNICSVEPPDFWQSVLAVVIICIANIVLRFWLRVSEIPATHTTQLLVPAIITGLVIAMSIRSGPFAAFKVTFVHVVLCGLIYCVVSVMGKALIAGVL
jgi:hypothetical protein